MITKSAIRIDGKIFTGTSHREIIYDIVTKKKAKLPLDGEQGFMNDRGKFLSREDAAIEALACGQITELKYCTTRLFSEDLSDRSFSYKIINDAPERKKPGLWDRAYAWFSQLKPVYLRR